MKIVEAFEKPPIIAAGICYVIGIVIVSLYLGQYGVTAPVNLFRINYLGAGLWFMVPIIWAVELFLTSDLRDLAAKPGNVNIVRDVLLPSTPNPNTTGNQMPSLLKWAQASHLSSSFFGILGSLAVINIGVELNWGWAIVAISCVLFMGSIYAALFAYAVSQKQQLPMLWLTVTPWLPVITFAAFLGYLYAFTVFGYKNIPSYLGGGKPTKVLIAVEPTKPAQIRFRKLGIPIDTASGITKECYLLYTTDSEYILLLGQGKNEHAITIRRDEVRAVTYQPKNQE